MDNREANFRTRIAELELQRKFDTEAIAEEVKWRCSVEDENTKLQAEVERLKERVDSLQDENQRLCKLLCPKKPRAGTEEA